MKGSRILFIPSTPTSEWLITRQPGGLFPRLNWWISCAIDCEKQLGVTCNTDSNINANSPISSPLNQNMSSSLPQFNAKSAFSTNWKPFGFISVNSFRVGSFPYIPPWIGNSLHLPRRLGGQYFGILSVGETVTEVSDYSS